MKYSKFNRKVHFVFIGNRKLIYNLSVETSLILHFFKYDKDTRERTRFSVLVNSCTIRDLVFEYQELFDNSYWRIVDLKGEKHVVELHRPQYEGRRKDFVDVEFIIGHLSHLVLQEKLRRWTNDLKQQLTISIS